MGIMIPQVITPSKASGAQVIDGSLRFDGGTGNDGQDTYLTKTPSSAGDQRTWTVSIWLKRTTLTNSVDAYVWESNPTPENSGVYFEQAGQLVFKGYASDAFTWRLQTTRVFRDTGWYHVVFVFDSTESTSTDRLKLYVNGVLETAFDEEDYPSLNLQAGWNNNVAQFIGAYRNPSNHYDGHMSQFYNIDGQALDASYFGFTDPLTNTWKPKKYTGTFGTNGFYLPMDGNSPIGKDQSGNGNDWTPVIFSGTVALDNPQVSGARPILNTTQGGTQAGVGVFGSKQNVGYAVTVYNDGGGNKY